LVDLLFEKDKVNHTLHREYTLCGPGS